MDENRKKKRKLTHIKLTSHPESGDVLSPIHWGAPTAERARTGHRHVHQPRQTQRHRRALRLLRRLPRARRSPPAR